MIFKVSKNTYPNKLAAAIINSINEGEDVKCIAIGKDAIENLMFALCIVTEKMDVDTEIHFGEKEKTGVFKLEIDVR
jgi:stage V sporulation protein SpoVS